MYIYTVYLLTRCVCVNAKKPPFSLILKESFPLQLKKTMRSGRRKIISVQVGEKEGPSVKYLKRNAQNPYHFSKSFPYFFWGAGPAGGGEG